MVGCARRSGIIVIRAGNGGALELGVVRRLGGFEFGAKVAGAAAGFAALAGLAERDGLA